MIIGIREDKPTRRFHLAPQPLKGLPEKVEQVARSLADPPLNVLTDVIEASANDGTGYLIVHIPASAAAPHMVDGRYYGRGDKTKYQMADAEVVRHHLLRKANETGANAATLLAVTAGQSYGSACWTGELRFDSPWSWSRAASGCRSRVLLGGQGRKPSMASSMSRSAWVTPSGLSGVRHRQLMSMMTSTGSMPGRTSPACSHASRS